MTQILGAQIHYMTLFEQKQSAIALMVTADLQPVQKIPIYLCFVQLSLQLVHCQDHGQSLLAYRNLGHQIHHHLLLCKLASDRSLPLFVCHHKLDVHHLRHRTVWHRLSCLDQPFLMSLTQLFMSAMAEKPQATSSSPLFENEEDREKFKKMMKNMVPYDPRFPNQNQTRNCQTNYLDYHRCLKAKNGDEEYCAWYKNAYVQLCPPEWYEKWDDQRERGIFPHRF